MKKSSSMTKEQAKYLVNEKCTTCQVHSCRSKEFEQLIQKTMMARRKRKEISCYIQET